MSDLNWRDAYLRLHPYASLKRLEMLYIYHTRRDDLYEVTDAAEAFLLGCDGTRRGAELTSEVDFVEYCLQEGLIEALGHPHPMPVSFAMGPHPSLRYLELQLLHQCNLKCRHCYLGPPRKDKLSLKDALRITREFASNGGLRLLISGGEPMLYPHLKEFIAETAELKLRRVLFTNGTLITEDNVEWLQVEEIQFSLDGWHHGHELLRGRGNFDRTLRGIMIARQAGIPLSIATMIHQGNLNEFERLQEFTQAIEALEWGVDVLSVAGSLKENKELMVPVERAVPLMEYAYGGGYHGSSNGFACGRHLMTVMPTGTAVKCGFYEQNALGDAREGLIDCWLKLKHIPVAELACKSCPVVDDCSGGCRFRAPSPLAPDPVMCAFYGIQTNRDLQPSYAFKEGASFLNG